MTEINGISLGIDFGTTYSKVCFRFRGSREFVKFGETQFRESIVYLHNDKLYYYRPVENSPPVKYFKYSIIGEELKNSEIDPKLSSVFFLMCLIEESKKYIKDFLSKKGWNENIGDFLSINMGAPIDNFIGDENVKNGKIYNKIIHSAKEMVQCDLLENYSCDLQKIQDYFGCIKNESTNNILPELYAETCTYLAHTNTADGLYAIIDIGGGTVDIGIFEKRGVEIFVRVKEIWCNGVEVLIAKTHDKSGLDTDTIRRYISERNCNLNEDAIKFLNEQKQEFNNIFNKVLSNLREYYALNKSISRYNENKIINILICGGGANCEWYRKCIDFNNLIEDNEFNHEGIPNKRLLISYALAQPLEDIKTEIKSWPLSEKTVKLSIKEYAEKENKRQDEENIEKPRPLWVPRKRK